MPDTIPDAEDTSMNKTTKLPCPHCAYILIGETIYAVVKTLVVRVFQMP